jgi:hypothetical protein
MIRAELVFGPRLTMKLRMDKILRFWVDAAYEHIKREHRELTKHQLVAQILRKYERRGDAMRCLNNEGKISWKATPQFLAMLADAERDAENNLDDF